MYEYVGECACMSVWVSVRVYAYVRAIVYMYMYVCMLMHGWVCVGALDKDHYTYKSIYKYITPPFVITSMVID